MVGFVDKLVVSVVEVEVEMEERKEKEDKGKENQSDQKKLISGMREEEKWMRETQRNKADGEAFRRRRRRRRRSTSLRLLFFFVPCRAALTWRRASGACPDQTLWRRRR